MILELAILNVRSGSEGEFEEAFGKAKDIITSMPGFLSLDLERRIETTHRYALLVRWERLEDHTKGFQKPPKYQEWKQLLHHFYDPFPNVEHYEKAIEA